jgi:hypothetical protein
MSSEDEINFVFEDYLISRSCVRDTDVNGMIAERGYNVSLPNTRSVQIKRYKSGKRNTEWIMKHSLEKLLRRGYDLSSFSLHLELDFE